MVARDVNHPSIILWGFFNEGQSDSAAAEPSYAAMASVFRNGDPTRLVTWADNRLDRSKMYHLADVISFNSYPGWYNGPADDILEYWSSKAAWAASQWPEKPLLISETGAGGIFGNHSANASRWSEEYQRKVDRLDATVAMQNANFSGIALWQFCDIKVDQANSSTGRPGGINNKGVLSQTRLQKPAAAAVGGVFART